MSDDLKPPPVVPYGEYTRECDSPFFSVEFSPFLPSALDDIIGRDEGAASDWLALAGAQHYSLRCGMREGSKNTRMQIKRLWRVLDSSSTGETPFEVYYSLESKSSFRPTHRISFFSFDHTYVTPYFQRGIELPDFTPWLIKRTFCFYSQNVL